MTRKTADPSSTDPRRSDTATYSQTRGGARDTPEPNRRDSRMPHERDESARATGDRLQEDPVPSDEQMTDALDDIRSGRKDTDRTGTPNDVPTRNTPQGE